MTALRSPHRKLLVANGVLAIVAIAMSVWAHWTSRFPGDLSLTLLFQSLHSNTLLSFMKCASYVADSWRAALLVAIGCLVVLRGVGRFEAVLVAAAGLSSLLDAPLKIMVGRPRPTPDVVRVWVAQSGNGFPSGHALFAAVFLGIMAYFAFVHVRRPVIRLLVVAGLLDAVVLVGASRIYLGVHWPSDVLGGYLIGALFLGMFIWFDRAGNGRLGDPIRHLIG
jgi:undecaprenyl-diphosphatase